VSLPTLDRKWKKREGAQGSYDPSFPKPKMKANGAVEGWYERDVQAYNNGNRLPVAVAERDVFAEIDETGEYIEMTYRVPLAALGEQVGKQLAVRLALSTSDDEIAQALENIARPHLIDEITRAVDKLRKNHSTAKLPRRGFLPLTINGTCHG
jgi:hypothetical protein